MKDFWQLQGESRYPLRPATAADIRRIGRASAERFPIDEDSPVGANTEALIIAYFTGGQVAYVPMGDAALMRTRGFGKREWQFVLPMGAMLLIAMGTLGYLAYDDHKQRIACADRGGVVVLSVDRETMCIREAERI